MPLLVIDTALEACSVAVAAAPEAAPIVVSRLVGRGHAEHLPAMVSEALAAAGLAIGTIDRIATTVGPGSFAGVRIGVAAARALSLVLGAPAIGLSTLAAHAESARALAAGRPVMAVLAGRGADVYAQPFAADGNPAGPPAARPAADVAVDAAGGGFLLAGSGGPAVAALGGADLPVLHRRSSPEPRVLVALAWRAPLPDRPPAPLYLRPPDAVPMATDAAVARRAP